MKIVVTQFYTSNVAYGEYSEKINRDYCNKNGYEYFVEKDKDKIKNRIGVRSWTWYKPFLIEEVFSKHPDCDYVLFMDMDAIFCNNDRRIEEFITNDFSILMTEDYGPSLVNAGVMLLKNNQFSKNFIKQWWDICEEYPQYKEGLWHDQTCIGLVHERLNKPKEFKIIHNFDFNAREYNENRFIFHAFSYGATPYRSLDKIYHKKFKTEISNKSYQNIKAIVYHIYCVGNYIDIVTSQIRRLKESGLYDWCDVLEVSCVDPKNEFKGIDNIFNDLTKTKLFKTNENKYEYWGIKKVWDLSQKYDGQVFYFHAKGVSNTYTNLKSKDINEWKVKSVSYWREMLEYFLIDNFKSCLDKLKDNDNCGVTCNNGWFWGNFWWSNLSFVRDNSEPGFGDRWYYEAWLNNGRNNKCYEFYKFNFNGYLTLLPEEIYKEKNYFNNRIVTIKSSQYGSLGIQLDEGYSIDTPLSLIDVTDIVKKHFKNNQLSIMVDNSLFGNDPSFGHRKFLLVNIEIDGSPYKLVFNEGTLAKFNFN